MPKKITSRLLKRHLEEEIRLTLDKEDVSGRLSYKNGFYLSLENG